MAMHDRATADDARNSAGFRRRALLLLAAGALPGALVARAGPPGAVSYAELTGSHFVAVPADPLQAPSVTEMTLPQIPDGNGI